MGSYAPYFLRAEYLHKLFGILLYGRFVYSSLFVHLFIQSFIYISMNSWVVLVHSGCCNKIPQTGWPINNRNLFFTVLDAGKSKAMVQLGWVRTLFWITEFLCSHMVERGLGSLRIHFDNALMPFMRVPPFASNTWQPVIFLLSFSIILPFPECCIIRIIQHAAFSD